MRWNKVFDGSKESLLDRSHRPHTPHPNSHTSEEIKKIVDLMRRNPDIGLNELFSKLRLSIGYARHPVSLYRWLKTNGYYGIVKVKQTPYTPKPYKTPEVLGEKWQIDVKYVPKECKAQPGSHQKYYQYMMIDEASRERFIYPYLEQSSYSTVDFVKRAIAYFGYQPKMIQSDNGFEFTHNKNTKMIHSLDILCGELAIIHKLIRPRTPRHNGKVKRSHRNDKVRFYSTLKFYNYNDLVKQTKAHLIRSNNFCSSSIGWLTPLQKRDKLIKKGMIA
jgi:transposase InsO family protein